MSASGSAVALKDRQRGRRYTAQHKLTVLWQTDACTELGEIGVLHRWEGLPISHLPSDAM
jgi:hypothetical protein